MGEGQLDLLDIEACPSTWEDEADKPVKGEAGVVWPVWPGQLRARAHSPSQGRKPCGGGVECRVTVILFFGLSPLSCSVEHQVCRVFTRNAGK